MNEVLKVIQERHSDRVEFDPDRPPSKQELKLVLEAARWSPTAHNMQNYEIVVVDDRSVMEKIGKVKSRTSIEFLRENYDQLSFSRKEWLRKKVGILASRFPSSWTDPTKLERVAKRSKPTPLSERIDGSPILLVVTYDPRKRAPASEGDILGFMSIGCVMENMWLMAQSVGLSLHILSVLGNKSVEGEVKEILKIPAPMKIAFGLRLGHPISKTHEQFRVRRDIEDFAHHNMYGTKGVD